MSNKSLNLNDYPLEEIFTFVGSFCIALVTSLFMPDTLIDVNDSIVAPIVHRIVISEDKVDNVFDIINNLIKTFSYLISIAGSVYAFISVRKKEKMQNNHGK